MSTRIRSRHTRHLRREPRGKMSLCGMSGKLLALLDPPEMEDLPASVGICKACRTSYRVLVGKETAWDRALGETA